MKYWIGFITGAALGTYVVSGMTVERRRATARTLSSTASKLRSTQIGGAVTRGISDIASAAGARASSVVSSGADHVADVVEPDDAQTDGAETDDAETDAVRVSS